MYLPNGSDTLSDSSRELARDYRTRVHLQTAAGSCHCPTDSETQSPGSPVLCLRIETRTDKLAALSWPRGGVYVAMTTVS